MLQVCVCGPASTNLQQIATFLSRITLTSVACPAPLHIFRLLSQTARFSEKFVEYRTCVLNLSTTFDRNISHSNNNLLKYYQIYFGLHVKCPLFLSEFNETWSPTTEFEKSSNIKLHENPSKRQPYCSMRTDRQT